MQEIIFISLSQQGEKAMQDKLIQMNAELKALTRLALSVNTPEYGRLVALYAI